MSIAKYMVKGVQAGFGASCGCHWDVDDSGKTECKKVLTYGPDASTDAELLLMIKRWLLMGTKVSKDGEDSRTETCQGHH